MASESMAQGPRRVIVGVDTHKDIHVARAKDELGGLFVPPVWFAIDSALRPDGSAPRG
jgi:hypothetical protein